MKTEFLVLKTSSEVDRSRDTFFEYFSNSIRFPSDTVQLVAILQQWRKKLVEFRVLFLLRPKGSATRTETITESF